MKVETVMRWISSFQVFRTVPPALLAIAGLLGLATPQAAAQTSPQLNIVFDGSGSIWGRIDGTSRSKLVLAREELSKALRAKIPNATIGLTSFGAQSGNSCTASEQLVAPAPGQLDAIDQALNAFNPQGRGPVVLGLTTAVDAVSKLTGKVRLLLIHDSPDNCGQDACAFADDLARSHPNIAVDVISVAMKERDKGAMACLTKATGGQLREADNADDVIAALDSIITAMANATPSHGNRPARSSGQSGQPTLVIPPTVSQGQSGGMPAPAASAAAKKPITLPGIVLSARLKGAKSPIIRGLSWHIVSIAPTQPVDLQPLAQPLVSVALPTGQYRITLQTATRAFTKTVTVERGEPQPVTFEFDGGMIDVITRGDKAATSSPDTLVTIVKPAIPAAGVEQQAIWSGPASAAESLLLSPGLYRISAGDGLTQYATLIDVATGTARTIEFVSKAARLTVAAVGLTAQEQASAEITVSVDDPTAAKGQRIVARSAAAQATFHLPPAAYRLALDVFESRATETVVLGAGQITVRNLKLPLMALSISSHLGKSKMLDGADLRYRLWRSNQLDEPIAESHAPNPVFHLATGKYRIESRIGHQNAVMTREFTVSTGKSGSLELRHSAGRVALALPATRDTARHIPYWEIVDSKNRLIWRTFDANPSLMLASGSYTATATMENLQYSANFTVVDGQSQSVTLAGN